MRWWGGVFGLCKNCRRTIIFTILVFPHFLHSSQWAPSGHTEGASVVLGVALCAKGGGGEAVRLEKHALRRPRDGIAPGEATQTRWRCRRVATIPKKYHPKTPQPWAQ